MIKCKINNIEYVVNDGFILRDKYTEELDSGVITIPFSDKLDLSPFDFVEIQDDRFGKKYFLIDTWTEDVVSFSPLKYNYNISLISETIKLQKVVMPNLAITQRIDSYKKTIDSYIKNYNDRYVFNQYPELYLGSDINYLTKKIVCPEMLFNRPTAYEVYNALLSKQNAIVTIKNHEIGYIKLDEYRNPIDENKLYYVTDTQNIEEYANRLDIQVNNGISDIDNVFTIPKLTFRAGEGEPVLSDENMSIVLEKPIYDFSNLEGIYVSYPIQYEGSDLVPIKESNITSNIVEKSVYDTYLASNSSDVITEKNYKRNALYYVRGSNKIEGLSYNEKYLFFGESQVALYNILQAIKERNNNQPALRKYNLAFEESDIINNVSFRIQYKTSESYRTNVEKESKYNSTLIDNQTETQVDANNFGKVEQDKLNRLGNKSKIITATYRKDEIIPELGDYIDEYVLAEREIVYYDDYALFKGYLYKNFVRKNVFYGISARKRSTQIDTETVIRNEVVNFDLSFKIEKQTGLLTYPELSRYILYPLMLSNSKNYVDVAFPNYQEFPKYAFISTTTSLDEPVVSNGGAIILTPSTYISGRTNIIHFQFKDNFSAGMRLTDKVTIKSTFFGGNVGGRKQEYVKYVDEYGECRKISAFFCTNKRNEIGTITREIADNLPLVDSQQRQHILENVNYIVSSGSIEINKDSRETIAMSFNFNFKDSENVIVGTFAEKTGIVNKIKADNIGICYSLSDEYEKGDTYGLGNIVEDDSVTIDETNGELWLRNQEEGISYPYDTEFDNITLKLNGVDSRNWKSWGIVDKETGDLILGVNKGKETTIPTKIYLHCSKKDY